MDEAERQFALAHRVARLATADAAATPHVIPICYAVVEDRFYFVIDDKPKRTRRGLKRLRNLAENAHVALVIDDYSEDWRQLAYLLVQGSGEVVQNRDEYEDALRALRHRYPQYETMPLTFASHPMVRITPRRTHFWQATPPQNYS